MNCGREASDGVYSFFSASLFNTTVFCGKSVIALAYVPLNAQTTKNKFVLFIVSPSSFTPESYLVTSKCKKKAKTIPFLKYGWNWSTVCSRSVSTAPLSNVVGASGSENLHWVHMTMGSAAHKMSHVSQQNNTDTHIQHHQCACSRTPLYQSQGC